MLYFSNEFKGPEEGINAHLEVTICVHSIIFCIVVVLKF